MQASQSSVSQTVVEVKAPNDARKGYDFEDEVALHAMLTLKQHQALAKEVVFAGKFEDIVLVNNFNNSLPQEYYMYQLKNKTKSFTWDDLTKPKGPYSLQGYFDSYVNINKHLNKKEIKFLVIATTADLDPDLRNRFQVQQHQLLSSCCLRYILLDE